MAAPRKYPDELREGPRGWLWPRGWIQRRGRLRSAVWASSSGSIRRRCGRCTGQRLMRAGGLRGITREKGPRITLAGDGPDTGLDLVERDVTASAPNQLWVADITCWRTFAGWVYAVFVIDVFSRRVLGWQLSTSLPGRPRPGRASTSSRSRPLSTSTGSTIAGSTARSA